MKDKIENKLDEIAEWSNGIITAEVLAENGFSKYFIRKLEKSGSIYKYHHGIYMTDGFLPDDYHLFQNIYKDTIILKRRDLLLELNNVASETTGSNAYQ